MCADAGWLEWRILLWMLQAKLSVALITSGRNNLF